VSWSTPTGAASDFFTDVTYAAGYFVAVGRSGSVIYSADGKTWSTASAAPANYWTHIFRSGNSWVLLSTVDGVSAYAPGDPDYYYWFPANLPTLASGSYTGAFAVGDNIYATASAAQSKIAVLTNATSWDESALPVSAVWTAIAGSGDVVAAVSSAGAVYVSNDGSATWEAAGLSTAMSSPVATYTGGTMLVVSTASTAGCVASSAEDGFSAYDGTALPLFLSQIIGSGALAQTASGTYTGTGTGGNTAFDLMLELPFAPAFGFIINTNPTGRLSAALFVGDQAFSITTPSGADPTSAGQAPTVQRLTVTRYGNTITWVYTGSDAQAALCNLSGVTYQYIFFGGEGQE